MYPAVFFVPVDLNATGGRMTDKELRHLSRMELIRLLLMQAKELERVQEELTQARKALEDRRIAIADAGSIAEAALSMSGVMEAAQRAADLYLENVKREYEAQARAQAGELQARLRELEDSTRAKCAAMLQDAKRKAEGYGG